MKIVQEFFIDSKIKFLLKDYIKESIFFLCTILIILFVSCTFFHNIDLWYKRKHITLLEAYQHTLKVMILENIEVVLLQNELKSVTEITKNVPFIKNYVKNHNFTSKPSLYIDKAHIPDVYINLQDIVNNISRDDYFYSISINGEEILNNGNILKNEFSISKSYEILQNIYCNIEVQLNPNSNLVLNDKSQLFYMKLRVAIGLLIITAFAAIIMILLFRRDRMQTSKQQTLNQQIQNLKERNKNILYFQEQNRRFITETYEYSKTLDLLPKDISYEGNMEEGDNYLPLPLIVSKNSKTTVEIELYPLIKDLKCFFEGYKALYSERKLNLQIESKIQRLNVSIEKVIFYQLIISTFLNVLHFNKDEDNIKYIKVNFQKNKIKFSSNGFCLDENLLVKYSEKIFYDTGNLYILNFRQIFTLLKKFYWYYKIENIDYETRIEISFNHKDKKKKTTKAKNESNIINFLKPRKPNE